MSSSSPVTTAVAVRAIGLTKTYSGSNEPVEAVKGIDLTIGEGEFFGLLGPNGAGKSTTIGMLTTLIMPTAGSASVLGVDVAADPVAVKRHIGMVSQNNTLDQELRVVENLEFRGRYFGLSGAEARQRAAELLEFFELTDKRDAMPRELSGGQARRLMICRALTHRPAVLFLDEPTVGLDPQTRVNLHDTLRLLQDQGQTVVLTTHYMEEAEALCDRVAVIDHGELLACDTVASLKSSAGADTVVTVVFEGAPPAGVGALDELPAVSRVEIDGDRVRVFAHPGDGLLSDIVSLGNTAGIRVREANQLLPSLETVYLTLTGREYRE
jgi:ABC-type multidrug transport system ATPase subunit